MNRPPVRVSCASRYVWLVAVSALLMGCASSSAITMTQPPSAPLTEFKTVTVRVDSRVEDTAEEVQQLSQLITAGLKQNGRWQVVDGTSDLVLAATVTDMHKVNRATRVMVGAIAGQASVDCDVEVRNARGVLSRFTVKGKSSGGTIFAGTTEQALEKAAEQIVQGLEQR